MSMMQKILSMRGIVCRYHQISEKMVSIDCLFSRIIALLLPKYKGDIAFVNRVAVRIMNHLLNFQFFSHFDKNRIINESEYERCMKIVQMLTIHDLPLEYIEGNVSFLNIILKIAPSILIPRPETEYWCHQLCVFLKMLKEDKFHFIDIGSGSGCLGISIAKAFSKSTGIMRDISYKAVYYSKKNSKDNGVANRVRVEHGAFFGKKMQKNKGVYDLIVANPPYIDKKFYPFLDPSVKKWESKNALFSKDCGMAHLKKIFLDSVFFLKNGGIMVIECDVAHHDFLHRLAVRLLGKKYFFSVRDQYQVPRSFWIFSTERQRILFLNCVEEGKIIL